MFLQQELIARYGLGKSFRDGEQTSLAVGTEIGGRWDRKGWHHFLALVYGHWEQYAVPSRQILDAALEIKE